jgi:response regulator RpfG family c-di-GMP phosphodiesterase
MNDLKPKNILLQFVQDRALFSYIDRTTMLLSLYARLRAENFTDTVVIDSGDTDVYVQAAYVSHQIRGDLLMKRKDGSVNCHAMLSDDVARVIIPLHVITGSDHTSGFNGQGKKELLQKVINDPGARELLGRVGENLELQEKVKDDMKAFVLSKPTKVYDERAYTTCGHARASNPSGTK